MSEPATNLVPINRSQSFSLAPRDLTEAMQFAKLVADSDLAPKDYRGKPGNVVLAIQWGAELGIAPLQALQNISVINGRPAIWGDLALAIVLAAPVCDYARDGVEGNVGWCEAKRKGQEPVRRTFSMEDAKRAGLLGKQGPWAQYPQRMLQLRARGFALRDAFPDVLKGVITTEEAQDIPVDTLRRVQAEVIPPSQMARTAFTARAPEQLPPPKEEASYEVYGAIQMIQAIGSGYKPEIAQRFFGEAVRFKADIDALKAKDETAFRMGYDQLHAAYNDFKRGAQAPDSEPSDAAEPEHGDAQEAPAPPAPQPPAAPAPADASELETYEVHFIKRGKTRKGDPSVGILLKKPGASRDDKGFWVNAYGDEAEEYAGIAEDAKKKGRIVSIETEELDGGTLKLVSFESHDDDVEF